VSATLLRQKLTDEAEFVIDQYIARAKDMSLEHKTDSINAQREIWTAIIPILQQAGDIKKLEAKNSADVIKLVGTGKITVAEAKDLMLLFHQQMEIEEVPKLLAAIEASE
jgi:hypothetical protein